MRMDTHHTAAELKANRVVSGSDLKKVDAMTDVPN